MPGIQRWTERLDRHADRTAPNPNATGLRGAALVICWSVAAVLQVGLARHFASWEVNAIAAFYAAIIALHIAQQIHLFRYSRWRASGIYGSHWRTLSKAERAAGWQRYREYCLRYQQWVWYQQSQQRPMVP